MDPIADVLKMQAAAGLEDCSVLEPVRLIDTCLAVVAPRHFGQKDPIR